jgi:hypothetical protein
LNHHDLPVSSEEQFLAHHAAAASRTDPDVRKGATVPIKPVLIVLEKNKLALYQLSVKN